MEKRIKGHIKPNRSNSSNRWMHEHVTDPFVQQAKKLGYRSRATFKLLEIDKKHSLVKPGMVVVDLGAAPGGWSQIVAPKVGKAGTTIAIDLLDMPGLAGVTFIQGDFSEQSGLAALEGALQGRAIDLVLSDMAPNITGIGVSDQAKSMYLCELALDFCKARLKPNGNFVVKTFQGSGFTEFLAEMRKTFVKVASEKPEASRGRSTEMYLVGLKKKAVS
jgi:23S rRNA (uridine2552-2'-O)-methyltransferase